MTTLNNANKTETYLVIDAIDSGNNEIHLSELVPTAVRDFSPVALADICYGILLSKYKSHCTNIHFKFVDVEVSSTLVVEVEKEEEEEDLNFKFQDGGILRVINAHTMRYYSDPEKYPNNFRYVSKLRIICE